MKRVAFHMVALHFIAVVAVAQPIVVDLGLLPGDATVSPASNSQQDHSVARGGNQYLVAWSDYRARSAGSQSIQSDGDIFGIRVDQNGEPIDPSPFLIAGGMGLQRLPRVAWNGTAWLVLFVSQDPVGGYYEDQLRAVRVSAQGVVLDTTPILFPPTQFTPSTIGLALAGQDGQWLVTRCIYHDDGYGTYLAGQRIDGSGLLIDFTPIMLNDWVYGQTTTVVSNGEYLVVGSDWSNSANIKARRIGLNGQPIGASFSVPGMTIAGSGSEYYVVWIADFVNLVGSRVTLDGTLLTPAGTVIVPNFSQYTHSTLTHDGLNWWLEWGVSDQLHTVRINAAGIVLDQNGGPLLPITIGGNVNTAYGPMLAPRSGGGVNLFWFDLRVALGYDANVFVMPVSAANVAGAERCISTGTRNQRNAAMSIGPNNTSAVAFVSEAANDGRVLVHLLSPSGQAIMGEPIEVSQAPTVGRVGIAWNGSVFLVVWDEGSSGLTTTQIKARRMNADGSIVDATPINVMTGFNAAVGALGDDFLVACARYGTYPQNIFLYGNRVDGPTGSVLDGSAGLLLGGGYVNGAPRVRTDGTQWLVAAHSMWTHDSSQGDALLAKVSATGVPMQAINPTPISGGSGDLDIAFSGSEYLLVWRMNSLSNANNYIAGRIMNADGSFPPGYFTIGEAAGRQLRPSVIWDGSTFVVAWDDQRNQGSFFDARTDIYGTRVTQAGVVLDAGGFPIVTGPQGDASVALMTLPGGMALAACNRFETATPFSSYRIGISRLGSMPIPGDVSGDGILDDLDLYYFVEVLLGTISDPDMLAASDLNHDGSADGADLKPFVQVFLNQP